MYGYLNGYRTCSPGKQLKIDIGLAILSRILLKESLNLSISFGLDTSNEQNNLTKIAIEDNVMAEKRPAFLSQALISSDNTHSCIDLTHLLGAVPLYTDI